MKLYTEKYDFTKPWLDKKIALVLIHGLGANKNMWFPQIPDFAKVLPIISVDLPGCGKSQKLNKDITIENISNSIKENLKDSGYDKFVVLGISLGGFVALDFAVKNPDVCAGVIFASTPYAFQGDFKENVFKMLKTYETMSVREIAEQRISKAFKSPYDKRVIPYLVDMIAKTPHEIYIAYSHSTLKYNSLDNFKKLKAPCLIIAGESDYLAGPEQAEKIKRVTGNSKVNILENTGHASSLDNPEGFNQAVVNFLTKELNIEC